MELRERWMDGLNEDFRGPNQANNEFFLDDGEDTMKETCHYSVRIYATEDFQGHFFSQRPIHYMIVVCFMNLFGIMVFVVYNYWVERRQQKLLDTAVRSNAVVNSLFPLGFRDRLFSSARKRHVQSATPLEEGGFFNGVASPKVRSTNILSSDQHRRESHVSVPDDEPIAEMFTNCTVIFADIAGFTAWSSQREPRQFFQLLETLYSAFDAVADTLGVFKVETIGDCYVAVTGLPTPQDDHALIMSQFAVQILDKMHELTRSLEITLGPGTSELALRVGCHSGQVTAGVLRGHKARFGLFGDAVNTAARMESTGERGKVQVSQDTADLISSAGNENWLIKRETTVEAKGKGKMDTYWIRKEELQSDGTATITRESRDNVSADDTPTSLSPRWDEFGPDSGMSSRKQERLIDWNVDRLLSFLKKLNDSRRKIHPEGQSSRTTPTFQDQMNESSLLSVVSEVIRLTPFDPETAQTSPTGLEAISDTMRAQLRDYVAEIASLYRDVPFHNFEHSSHVVMSANKLLNRIISSGEAGYDETARPGGIDMYIMGLYAAKLHSSTFGISSDPLAQFSIVFAALVHDVGHKGVPNTQLVKESDPLAIKYDYKSVAEQNSIDIALCILDESKYNDLQACIYSNEEGRLRFRQLLVNSVMATDIIDQELHALRKRRWAKAFRGRSTAPEGDIDVNRKATIVIEHIIQASDVAHTMQHWHIFTKWNERLYREMYFAYLDGRAEKDPSDSWYDDQISFFDHYIIPLAKDLKECGVFGVSSVE